MQRVLGISAYYHDSAAALVVERNLLASAQEERFSRHKNDAGFPVRSLAWLAEAYPQDMQALDAVVFYEKPLQKLERILQWQQAVAPRAIRSFLHAVPEALGPKLFVEEHIRKQLKKAGLPHSIPVLFSSHHLSHAASAYYCSAFAEAAILTVDGVGEHATTALFHATDNAIQRLATQQFPNSLGLFYSAMTQYCGFKVLSGEYKFMGLAAFAARDTAAVQACRDTLLAHVIRVGADGAIHLNQRYFRYLTGTHMVNTVRLQKCLGIPARAAHTPLLSAHAVLACAVQTILEEALLRLAHTARDLTGCTNLVLAGGVALNCVANARVTDEGPFENVFVFPAAGDAGGAAGAALFAAYQSAPDDAEPAPTFSPYLGPAYSDEEIAQALANEQLQAAHFATMEDLYQAVVQRLQQGHIGGWFQGRMELGPRALGNRSLLADPRSQTHLTHINKVLKEREGFRPFAPVILQEHLAALVQNPVPSPYMLRTGQVRTDSPLANGTICGFPDDLATGHALPAHSPLPATTHIDGSMRYQSVSRTDNPVLHGLLTAFYQATGCPALLNTSLNGADEPIVCTPLDAISLFQRRPLDFLAIGQYLVEKRP